MISVIICSRDKDASRKLSRSISDTIGTEYELSIIDNIENNHSLFTAYNNGVNLSKGDILRFCHEDILFHTPSWGVAIEALFKDESIGERGVIGTHFLPAAPMYWWSSPYISQYSINNDNGKATLNDTRDYFKGHLADVVALDGVCFFIPKTLFNFISFDNKTYNGFHAYDMDISMQVQALGKRVCVTDVLTVEHFWSEDSFQNQQYMDKLDDNLNLFYQKWKNQLPIVRGLDASEIVTDRLNNLCIQAYDAIKVRRSHAYRLGRILLKPFKLIKSLL